MLRVCATSRYFGATGGYYCSYPSRERTRRRGRTTPPGSQYLLGYMLLSGWKVKGPRGRCIDGGEAILPAKCRVQQLTNGDMAISAKGTKCYVSVSQIQKQLRALYGERTGKSVETSRCATRYLTTYIFFCCFLCNYLHRGEYF